MYIGQVAAISNRATWQSQTYELVDEADNTTTDLSAIDADDLDIEVTIKPICGEVYGSALATATIANGKIQIPGPGFYWQFEVDDLTSLCPGTYHVGAKITIDDFVTDIIIGTLAVIEGN